eukprot:TRINITY_DN3810_c0_g1_i1.p1 TRINITY_DN3810_c0_g1~~TRINITY_DN3810_c0_g1_i1.p1  ORF type:complete len:998 (+),score=202.79 TRINITY_DN3810_c0_g1_i1:77-3070(+)
MSERDSLLEIPPENDVPIDRPVVTFCFVLVASVAPLLFGFSMGYTSPILRQIPFLGELGSLFSAILNVGAMFGAIISGRLADVVGRRNTLAIAMVPFIVGYFVLSFSVNLAMLFAGRVLTGISTGIVSVTTPVYISEISPARFRGAFGAINQLAIAFGILFAYLAGMGLNWQWLARCGGICASVLLLCLPFLPETPRWLLQSGKKDALARRSLQRLLGPSANIDRAIAQVQVSIAESPSGSIRELATAAVLKPLGLCMILFIAQQFSGANAVIFFAGDIFKAAGGPDSSAAIVGAVQVLVTFFSVILMDRLGRRVLLLISLSGLCASNAVLGGFYWLQPPASQPAVAPWLALVCLMSFIASMSIGLAAIPWLIMSEIIPARVRGQAAGIATMICWTCSFVVVMTFSSMNATMGNAATMWFYAGMCAASFVFVAVFIPETRGKTMEELERLFRVGSQALPTAKRDSKGYDVVGDEPLFAAETTKSYTTVGSIQVTLVDNAIAETTKPDERTPFIRTTEPRSKLASDRTATRPVSETRVLESDNSDERIPLIRNSAELPPPPSPKRASVRTPLRPASATYEAAIVVTNSTARTEAALLGQAQRQKIADDNRRLSIVQALWRGRDAKRLLVSLRDDFEYRRNVVREILETEQRYVDGLIHIRKAYMEPLKEVAGTSRGILTSEEISTIFFSIDALFRVNSELLSELNDRVNQWEPKSHIADVFLRMAPFFKSYAPYVTNYNRAMTALNDAKRKRPFVQFALQAKQSSPGGLELRGLLITPVQRLARYPLLLSDLLKHTSPLHRDYAPLEEALLKLKEIAAKVNEDKREAENVLRLLELQDAIEDLDIELVAPHRRLIQEDTLVYVGPDAHRSDINIFVFTDVVVLARASKPGHFQNIGLINLQTAIIGTHSALLSNFFFLIDSGYAYLLVAPDTAGRAQWVSMLNKQAQTQRVTLTLSPRAKLLSPGRLQRFLSVRSEPMLKVLQTIRPFVYCCVPCVHL